MKYTTLANLKAFFIKRFQNYLKYTHLIDAKPVLHVYPLCEYLIFDFLCTDGGLLMVHEII